jgi:hypothetical protein
VDEHKSVCRCDTGVGKLLAQNAGRSWVISFAGSPRGEEVEIGVNNIYAWGGRKEREGVVGESQTRGVSVVVAQRSEGVAWETQTRDLSVIVAQTRRNLTARDAGETWVIS